MTTPKDDVPTLQLEVLKRIQAELVNLNREVTHLKDEMSAVKSEVAGVKSEVAGVRSELKEEIAALRKSTADGFVRVRTELVGLRDDMEVGLRLQNDRRFLDHERRLRVLESDR